jgi:hypothetical protein
MLLKLFGKLLTSDFIKGETTPGIYYSHISFGRLSVIHVVDESIDESTS